MPNNSTTDHRLVTISGPLKGLELVIGVGASVLGRAETCDLCVPDATISKEHARLIVDSRGCHLQDLGSRNGLSINGEATRATTLQAGDVLTIGRNIFRYQRDETPDAAAPHITRTMQARVRSALMEDAGAQWRADQYSALLHLSEELLAGDGSARLEQVFAGWLRTIAAAERVRILRRRDHKLYEAGHTDALTDADLPLPRDVIESALKGRECQLLQSEGHDAIVVVPLGAPATVGFVVEGGPRKPTKDTLRVIACGSHLATLTWNQARQSDLDDAARQRLQRPELDADFVASSPAMEPVVDFVTRAGPTGSTVLLLGESGSGKEVIARRLHESSPRVEGPFVVVNCGSLPDTLVESELFGHEKGAFTGATNTRAGRFEQAHGGTLFLDEIGELSHSAQTRLLRVLEDFTIERLGGGRQFEVDVRVLAATHRDLRQRVADGDFREDLFYRLSVLVLEIPPLRARPEDVGPLAEYLLDRARRRTQRRVDGISDDAIALLRGYDWPGNVRQLRNAIERAVILGREPTIQPGDLPPELRTRPPPSVAELATVADSEDPVRPEDVLPLADVERRVIFEALRATNQNKSKAAELLGIDRKTLYARLRAYAAES